MSVLLDALKKAAESKKETEQPRQDSVQPDVDDNLHEEKVSSTSVASEAQDRGISTSSGEKFISEKTEEINLKVDEPVIQETSKPLSIDELDSQVVEQESDLSRQSNPVIADELSIDLVKDAEKPSHSKAESHDQQTVESVDKSGSSESDVDKSYDWSLDKLPGYQRADVGETKADPSVDLNQKMVGYHNEILTTNKRFLNQTSRFSLRQFLFGTSSNVTIYALFAFFTASILGFFSVYYFQEQSYRLDQSMQKYHLVRMDLQSENTVQPKDTAVVSTISEDALVPPETQVAESSGTENLDQTVSNENAAVQSQVKALNKEILMASSSATVESTKSDTPQQKVVAAKPLAQATVSTSREPSRETSRKVEENNAVRIATTNEDSDIQKAYQALYSGQLVEAETLFSDQLSKSPNQVESLNGLGSIYMQQGKTKEAIQTFQAALKHDEDNLFAYESLVTLADAQMQGQDAWQGELQSMLQKFPESGAINSAMGNYYASLSNWQNAQEHYFKAYAVDSTNPGYLTNLAVSLDHLGEYQLAEQYYTQALLFAKEQPAFDIRAVKERLITLRQYIGQTQ